MQAADDHQLNAAATDLIDKSLDTVLDMWRKTRDVFKTETTPTTPQPVTPSAIPKLTLPGLSAETTASVSLTPQTPPTSPIKIPSPTTPTTPTTPTKADSAVVSPVTDKQPSITEQPVTESDENKENMSSAPGEKVM